MKVQTSGTDDSSKQDVFARRRSPLPTILLALNALVVGGCLSLLLVNRLLQNQLDVYIAGESMDAASAIIDFMDDLLPFYVICGSVFLLVLLFTMMIWTWTRSQSRFWRVVSVSLFLLGVAAVASVWFTGFSAGPLPLP